MKKIITLLGLLASLTVNAFTEVDSQNMIARNMVKNPGFENGFTNWSVLNGSAATTTTVGAVGFGNAAVIFTPSGTSTSSIFKANDFVLSSGLYSGSCMAKVFYRGSANGYRFSVLKDDDSVIAGSVLQDSSTYGRNSFAFQCPSTPTRLRAAVVAPAGFTNSVLLDNFFVGEDYTQITQLTRAVWMGYFHDDCGWTTASASFVTPSADASCTANQLQNVGFGTVTSGSGGTSFNGVQTSRLPQVTFTPPRAGIYRVVVRAMLQNSTTNYSQLCLSTDGTSCGTVGSANLIGNANTYLGPGPQQVIAGGLFSVTSLAPMTIYMQIASDGGATATLGKNTPGLAINRYVEVEVEELR